MFEIDDSENLALAWRLIRSALPPFSEKPLVIFGCFGRTLLGALELTLAASSKPMIVTLCSSTIQFNAKIAVALAGVPWVAEDKTTFVKESCDGVDAVPMHEMTGDICWALACMEMLVMASTEVADESVLVTCSRVDGPVESSVALLAASREVPSIPSLSPFEVTMGWSITVCKPRSNSSASPLCRLDTRKGAVREPHGVASAPQHVKLDPIGVMYHDLSLLSALSHSCVNSFATAACPSREA